MTRRNIDPWEWQQGFGFSHGVEYPASGRVVEVSGQCATGADGAPQCAGDMRGQIDVAMKNIAAVLEKAGLGLGDVVRIRVYVTDVEQALGNWDAVTGPLNAAGSRPASTLLGVSALFLPEFMVEIEATAVGNS